MSKQERLMKQGLLAELRTALAAGENRAENHNAALRNATFAVESYGALDDGNVMAAAEDLCQAIRMIRDTQDRIYKLEDELGV